MTRFLAAGAVALVCLAPAFADDKSTKSLDGTYTLKAMSKGGKAIPNEVIVAIESITLKAGEMTTKVGSNSSTSYIDIDASKKPMTLEMKVGKDDKAHPGLVGIDKDEVTIVFSEDGIRPKTLDGTGAKETKMVLKKVK
jgi:uncharacterized protein (TIGR03067 family)